MKFILALFAALALCSTAFADTRVVKKKAVQIVEMKLEMKLDMSKCTYGPWDNGEAYVSCAYSIGAIPKNGEFKNAQISRSYFSSEITFDEKNVYVLFTGGTALDFPDAIPEEFYKEVLEYFEQNETYLTLDYFGPDFDISEFGKPI